jgi:hypothetical protein
MCGKEHRKPFEENVRELRPRLHVGGEKEAVDGVNAKRDSREKSRILPKETRFRRVGVDDVEALAAEDAPERKHAGKVGPRGHPTRHGDGDVANASRLQCGYAGAGSGDTDDFVSSTAEGLELVEEEKLEGDVRGGDVGDADWRDRGRYGTHR